jgi:hypothetical protein
MKKTLLSLLLLPLVTFTLPVFSESYEVRVPISDFIISSVFRAPAGPLAPVFAESEWVTFFNNKCGTSFVTAADYQNRTSTIPCYSAAITDADMPSAGLGTSIHGLSFWSRGITNVDFLEGLETVTTDLYIQETPLQNVNGLSSLA